MWQLGNGSGAAAAAAARGKLGEGAGIRWQQPSPAIEAAPDAVRNRTGANAAARQHDSTTVQELLFELRPTYTLLCAVWRSARGAGGTRRCRRRRGFGPQRRPAMLRELRPGLRAQAGASSQWWCAAWAAGAGRPAEMRGPVCGCGALPAQPGWQQRRQQRGVGVGAAAPAGVRQPWEQVLDTTRARARHRENVRLQMQLNAHIHPTHTRIHQYTRCRAHIQMVPYKIVKAKNGDAWVEVSAGRGRGGAGAAS